MTYFGHSRKRFTLSDIHDRIIVVLLIYHRDEMKKVSLFTFRLSSTYCFLFDIKTDKNYNFAHQTQSIS